MAAELVANTGQPYIIFCQLNAEGEMLDACYLMRFTFLVPTPMARRKRSTRLSYPAKSAE